MTFQSTPSVKRATDKQYNVSISGGISIHTLCEEGDQIAFKYAGILAISIHTLCEEGDNTWVLTLTLKNRFQSTPSVKRATLQECGCFIDAGEFQSTPSVKRATIIFIICNFNFLFQSTPSVKRATQIAFKYADILAISIHTLCEEGDNRNRNTTRQILISIHTLCEEGDPNCF